MRYLKFIFILFVISSGSLYASSALAHESQTDGTINVIMHMEPEDDPLAGRPATIFFDITDSTKHFTPENCSCSLTITSKDKQVLLTTLQPATNGPSIFSFEAPFTFPKNSEYKLTLTGTPKNLTGFNKFSVQYDVPVDFIHHFLNDESHHAGDYLHLILFGGGVLIAAIIVIREKRKLKRLS